MIITYHDTRFLSHCPADRPAVFRLQWIQLCFLVRIILTYHSSCWVCLCLCVFVSHSFNSTLNPCCILTGLISSLYAHLTCPPPAVGPLELANALAACCLSSRLSSQHRQWAAQQLVRTLAAHDRDNQSRPQTFADMAGDLRKCSTIKLEAHQSRVSHTERNKALRGSVYLLIYRSKILIFFLLQCFVTFFYLYFHKGTFFFL